MKDTSCFGRSKLFVAALNVSLFGTGLLFVAFSTNHWLESSSDDDDDRGPTTSTSFVRLGLWTVCFEDYRHPTSHSDIVYDGCHSILGHRYKEIRSWLYPGWFGTVQLLMCVCIVLALITEVGIVTLFLRGFERLRVYLLIILFAFSALTALMAFLATSVFGSKCFDKAWIQHPNYNNLSWSFGCGVMAVVLEAVASILLLKDSYEERKYRASVLWQDVRHMPVMQE